MSVLKRRRGVLLAFVLGMISIVGGCSNGVPEPDASRAIAAKFLSEIKAGHAAQAWEATTAEFKSARGKEAFLREIRPDKVLKADLPFVSQQSVKVQDQDRPELLFRSAEGREIRIVLGSEGGAWKVDRWSHAK